jgi:hypothetical protein
LTNELNCLILPMPIWTKFKNFRDGGNQIAKFSVKIRIVCTNLVLPPQASGFDTEDEVFLALPEIQIDPTSSIPTSSQTLSQLCTLFLATPTWKRNVLHRSSFQVVATPK